MAVMNVIEIIKEWIHGNDFNADELLNSDKDYVIFSFYIFNAGYYIATEYTNEYNNPSESDEWNGYDVLLETSDVIDMYNN